LVGAISSDVTVLSNGPKESCFMLSANAASAHNAAVSLPNLLVLPMTDVSDYKSTEHILWQTIIFLICAL